MPVLLLVRHAETEKNVLHIVSHDPAKPYHLTNRGREQAASVARSLADVPITRAVASRYPRAQETASIILKGRDTPLEIDARLDEVDNGELEGKTVAQYSEAITDRTTQTPNGGESWEHLKARLRSFLDDVRRDDTVLVVSHGHPIAVLRGLIGGWDDHRMESAIPATASILRYEL